MRFYGLRRARLQQRFARMVVHDVTNPCRMLATLRASSSPALRAAPARASRCHAMCAPAPVSRELLTLPFCSSYGAEAELEACGALIAALRLAKAGCWMALESSPGAARILPILPRRLIAVDTLTPLIVMQVAGNELQHLLHIQACVRQSGGRAWEACMHGEHNMQAYMHACTLQKAAHPA